MDKLSQKEYNLAAKFLSVQNELNMKLSPEWDTKGWAYPDAMFTEAAEAYNHLNWEWWRATDRIIDWEQVKLEWVDVMHFFLSEIIVKDWSDQFISIVAEEIRYEKDYINGESPNLSRVKIGIKAFIDAVLDYDLTGQDSFKFNKILNIFMGVIWNLGLTLPEFFTLFIGKVCLNQLRWKNGYKKGIYGNTHSALSVEETKQYYIKEWNGVEDNVWLAEYAKTLNPQSPDFKEQLFAGLEAKYKEVYDKVWGETVTA